MEMSSSCPCGKSSCDCGGASGCAHGMHSMHPRPAKRVLMAVVAALVVIYLGTLIANNLKKYDRIGRADVQQQLITIAGSGKVTATPNIAVTNVGLVTEKASVAEAQNENSQKMNALLAAMQQLGISKEDIRTTQYQIYPKYSYEERRGSTITGYSVSQSVEVKIRDLSKISAVLAKAGEAGANQVSGIQFTIDEPKNLRAEAREAAVKDAKEKAEKLADDLGVKLGRVVNFSEYSGGGPVPPLPMYAKESYAGGVGAAPDVQAGTLEIQSEVSVTYEIQ